MDEGYRASPDRRERMDGKGGLRMGSLIKKLALPAIVLLWSAAYFIEVAGYSKKNQYLIKPYLS